MIRMIYDQLRILFYVNKSEYLINENIININVKFVWKTHLIILDFEKLFIKVSWIF